jgi:hypothetical protein
VSGGRSCLIRWIKLWPATEGGKRYMTVKYYHPKPQSLYKQSNTGLVYTGNLDPDAAVMESAGKRRPI